MVFEECDGRVVSLPISEIRYMTYSKSQHILRITLKSNLVYKDEVVFSTYAESNEALAMMRKIE